MTGTKASFLDAWARAPRAGLPALRLHRPRRLLGRRSATARSATGRATPTTRSRRSPRGRRSSSARAWAAGSRSSSPSACRAAWPASSASPPRPTSPRTACGRRWTPRRARGWRATARSSLPSDYGDEPYPITRRLIEDGREHLVLRDPLDLPFPVRLLHGTEDRDVPLRRRPSPHGPRRRAEDMSLTLVKGADHRFSAPGNLELLARAVEDIL